MTDGGGAGSQMMGDRTGVGRKVAGGGTGSQIVGAQQLVTEALLDRTIKTRRDFCASGGNLFHGIMVGSGVRTQTNTD